MLCPKCQSENHDQAKFCNECGVLLSENKLKRTHTLITEPERKRVTALFSDLSGYTAMTGKNDPELIKEITTTIFNETRKIIKNYDGFIERFAGDGGLALFGVPKAHENDSIRAINAAIDIHEFVKSISPRYETQVGTSLSMHSGINTGLAVTADVNPDMGTHGVTGNAINIAARLSDLASAHEIFVGEETYKVCKNNFSFESLTPARVKGKTDPIAIYKVLTTRKSTVRRTADRQVFSKIVGRDKELNKLALHVTSAIDGKGSVVNIVGEAGIGKSRLFAEFSKHEVVKNVTLLEGKAISIGRTLPFYPVIDFLKNWAKIDEDDNEIIVLSKLEALVQRIDRDSTNEIVPFVATMMGMRLSPKYKKRMEGIEGEALEKLIFKNLRDLLIKASKIKTLVIVIEDLHWADDSSIELLEVFFNLSKDYSILFVNVFRPGFNDTGVKILNLVQNDSTINSTKILLKPLSQNLSELMVNNMLKIKGLSRDVKHKIIDRTGGNPFFIEEVVRSFIDEGAILLKDNQFILTDKINTINIPHTISDLLTARIDRLEEKTRELVKIASVIGRNFFDKILKQVATSVGDIDTRLDYLKDIQIIRERDQIEELEYLFKHALAQEVAYKSLLHERRRELHLNVANSIEKLFKERLHEFYGTLSYHYTNAGALDKAEEYMLKAGEEAMKASASSEALGYYQKAIDLYANKHGKNVDKLKIAALQENIGTAFFNKGLFVDAIDYFDKSKVNRGGKKWELNGSEFFKLLMNLIVILRHLYLPEFGKKKISTHEQEDAFKKKMELTNALASIDAMRCFFVSMKEIRKGFEFDISKSQASLNYISAGYTLFALTGITFKIANKFTGLCT